MQFLEIEISVANPKDENEKEKEKWRWKWKWIWFVLLVKEWCCLKMIVLCVDSDQFLKSG